MQIVIDITEEDYNFVKKQVVDGIDNPWKVCIANGKPLPKGHGDLVDYEELKNNAREYGAYAEATLSHVKPITIIEADKEKEE